MTKSRTTLTFGILLLLLFLIAIGITLIRGGADLRPIDPKLTVGLTVTIFINVVKTFGMIVGLNVFIGFLLKAPALIVFWIPLGTVFTVGVHLLFASSFGLVPLEQIGRMDAFLMYLPAVGLASLAGGLLGNLFHRK